METKILKAVFGGGTSTVTNKRTRTDYGQVLEIIGIDLPDTFECIFSNSNTSAGVGKKMIGSAQRVLIPDEYLTTGQTIYAWILLHDTEDDGRHMYSIRIPVADMPDTSPEEPTPVEQSVISQAITALNSAVDTTTQKAQEATESADRAEQAAEGAKGYAERAEAAQSAAESARDRATQAETSARTSAATASEKASEAISSATTASQSALTAETASESARASATASAESASQASQSADTASGKASDASESAQEASGYASNANTSAQTASQKASEAAQSASTAVQAKTDAITAKAASETAQGLAESARDGAVSAKTGAESARDEAQSIADGITGKVEQIDSNTDRIESLEDDRYKPYATDAASGAVASFPDGADNIPLKSCIVRVEPVQEGSGDPSPDNVRPITGWTGAQVTKCGKNLLNPQKRNNLSANIQYYNDGTGFTLKANATYVFSVSATAAQLQIVQIGGTALIKNYGKTSLSYTPAKDVIVFFDAYYSSDFPVPSGGTRDVICQLELGSTATAYEPYTGRTYPITFPSEAGTVYGGTLDVTKGELVVDRICHTYEGGTDDVISARSFDNTNRCLSIRTSAFPHVVTSNGNAGTATVKPMCNILPIVNFDDLRADAGNAFTSQGNWPPALAIQINGLNTVAEYDAWCAENKPQISWLLATPIHYPLTPIEIKTLLGQNNLWADTGDVSVEYRADTRLYIEKLTQPEEDDMIADSAISEGQFFMVGNSLYRALANIASGATITVGTNAQRVSLSDALNLVNA